MWKQKIQIQKPEMHTDEFEISLSRELGVCRNTIKHIKKTLKLLEQKHNRSTEAFMEDARNGTLKGDPDMKEDYDAWQSSYESLKKWEELENQYVEIFNSMKI
jgi:flagellar biosynthesis chaperone FliJ